MMRLIEKVGLFGLLLGLPTAIGIWTLSSRSYWNGTKASIKSGLYVLAGIVTLVPFCVGMGFMLLEDWLDDRNDRLNNLDRKGV